MPCLVRRAALHAANVDDLARYRWDDLDGVMAHENRRDDLMAVARAVRRLDTEDADLVGHNVAWSLDASPCGVGMLERVSGCGSAPVKS